MEGIRRRDTAAGKDRRAKGGGIEQVGRSGVAKGRGTQQVGRSGVEMGAV